MKETKIETGVPIPVRGNTIYPWDEMNVGDSIVLNGRSRTPVVYQNRKKTGRRYITRAVIENGEKVVRVWRVQ